MVPGARIARCPPASFLRIQMDQGQIADVGRLHRVTVGQQNHGKVTLRFAGRS